MTISVNGEKADTRGAENIAELIERLQIPPQAILIEHNGLALRRPEWPHRKLGEGDQVEFIRVVAGG